jgi:DNA repair exonuclease SbcCD nuclease subunit
MKKQLKFAVISDIHLGNKRNNAESIITNLNEYFSNSKVFSNIDVAILAGDVFDEMLSFSSEEVGHICIWIARVLNLCKSFNVKLRILEGTPSHDRKQSTQFSIINKIYESNFESKIDLKYITALSIEYIEEYNINILYVPDEWNSTAEETLIQVKQLLVEKNINQVDFSVMHGNFNYQLPKIAITASAHIPEEYIKITKYLIWIGHIHIYSNFDKIYAQGSFDRLSHNEEGAKGYLLSTVNPDGSYEIKFVENVNAKKFITIDCTSYDLEKNIKKIDKIASKLKNGSFVRIKANILNPIFSGDLTLKRRWPNLVWSVVSEKEDSPYLTPIVETEFIYTPLIINKDNIEELILNRLKNKKLDKDVTDRCTSHLSDLKRA